MPISLICSCGARLEIDDKFAGQTIPCPDCNKPIVTDRPTPPITRTSGLAVLSLLLALIGAFTVVGTLAAMACGAAAIRRLSRQRGDVGGLRFAQAGVVLGGLFTLLALAAYSSPMIFGVDGLIRTYQWAGKLKFSATATTVKKRSADDLSYSLDRPTPLSAWGVLETQSSQKDGDHLMLVNPRDDAQIMWLSFPEPLDRDAATLRNGALDFFRGSDLVRMVGRLPDNVSESWKPNVVTDGENDQEFQIDVKLGGVARTYLFRVKVENRYVNVIVGGTRAQRFENLKNSLKGALASFKKLQEANR